MIFSCPERHQNDARHRKNLHDLGHSEAEARRHDELASQPRQHSASRRHGGCWEKKLYVAQTHHDGGSDMFVTKEHPGYFQAIRQEKKATHMSSNKTQSSSLQKGPGPGVP